jgi:DNA-binding transcriptional MerR regulator
MNVTIPDKTYFRIGEVSRILGVEPYVIRYWETEFKSIRPERSSSSQRLYRKKDLEQLLDIRRSGSKEPEIPENDKLLGIKKGLQELRKMIG